MDKVALRAQMRAARKAYVNSQSSQQLSAQWQAMAAQAFVMLDFYLCVGSYCPVGHEIGPACLEAMLRDYGIPIALPRVIAADMPLDFAHHAEADRLEPGPLGNIPQPLATSPSARPEALLVPLLAADVQCNRLGQGAGHYDRTIAALKPHYTMGLAYDCQIVDALPVESWDQPLDAIVTPTRLITRPR